MRRFTRFDLTLHRLFSSLPLTAFDGEKRSLAFKCKVETL